MTWSKYQRNCVYVGPLDGYCLVCEDHMWGEDEYDLHLRNPIHKQKLDATPYFEKYPDERFRKVKNGYYCEFCNVLLFNGVKVALHIVETLHIENRGASLLRREGNNVFAFKNILISHKAWNGFVDNNCIICNTEFENEDIHETEQSHTLNLIMKRVQFGEEYVYRRTDENSYQCLTCNLPIGSEQLHNHFKGDSHKWNLEKCRKDGETILKCIPKEIKVEPTSSKNCEPKWAPPPTGNKEEPIKKQHVKENAKQKPENVNSDNNLKKPKAAGDEGNKLVETISKGTMLTPLEMNEYICTIFKAKSYVAAFNEGTNMCLLCDWSMETHEVPSHVASRQHQVLLKMHMERLQRLSVTEIKSNVKEEKEQPNDLTTKDDKTRIFDSLQEFQSNSLNINFEIDLASCKKCKKSMKLDYDVLKSHIEDHKNAAKKDTNDARSPLPAKECVVKNNDEAQSQPSTETKELKRLKKFAKKNNLTCSDGKVTCHVCEAVLPLSMNSAKEHVEIHKNNSQPSVPLTPSSSIKSTNLKKVPMDKFIDSVISLEGSLLNDVIVNEKYNMNILSFLMITWEPNAKSFRCQVCDRKLHGDETDAHISSPAHLASTNNTMVIVNFDSEFIREPRAGVFHCGYCSKVFASWETVVAHLATTAHRESRASAQWRMHELRPQWTTPSWTQGEGGMMELMIKHARELILQVDYE